MAIEARVALIGYGLAGSAFHAPFIEAADGLRLTTVVTGDAGRAAAVRERYGAEVVPSADRLWERADELDLVVVASPNRHHFDQAAAALRAGLSVVVDKPVAATGKRVRELADLAERAGTTVTAFQNRRWDGDFRTVRALVADGRLGEVGRFESRFERAARPVRTAWKASADPADLADVLYDLGTHLIDQAMVLFGPPTTVYAESAPPRPGVGASEDATVLLTHAGGVRSYLRMSGASTPLGPRFAVAGPTAGYRCHGLDPQESAARGGARPTDPGFGDYPEARWGELVTADGTAPVPTLPGDYLAFYRGVARRLAEGGDPPVPIADSIALADVLDAALLSAATGSVIAR